MYHQSDHGDADHGFAGLRQVLIILRQAAVPAQPCEGPLDHPAFRQEEEAVGPLRPLDNFQADLPPRPQAPHPRDEVSRVCLIGPHAPHTGELMLQAREQAFSPGAVLHVGRGDHHGQQQP